MHTHKSESMQGYTPTSIFSVYIGSLALNPTRLYSVRRLDGVLGYLRIRRQYATVVRPQMHGAIPNVQSGHYSLDLS